MLVRAKEGRVKEGRDNQVEVVEEEEEGPQG